MVFLSEMEIDHSHGHRARAKLVERSTANRYREGHRVYTEARARLLAAG